MELALLFLKDLPRSSSVQSNSHMKKIFQRALEWSSKVTQSKLVELEEVWKKNQSKKTRVLFVKDGITTDRTYMKTLPQLPDDDQTTEQKDSIADENSSSGNVQDYGLEISQTPSVSKSAHSTKPRKMNAPIAALTASYNDYSQSAHKFNSSQHISQGEYTRGMKQRLVVAINLSSSQRSPKKQNVIFEQQSPRNFRVETPNSDDVGGGEDSERRNIHSKQAQLMQTLVKPLGNELSKMFDQGNKEEGSVFQSPMMIYTNRSLNCMGSHAVQQERKINNPLASSGKFDMKSLNNDLNSENIDPNTVRGGGGGNSSQFPFQLETKRRSPTPSAIENAKFSATMKVHPLAYLQHNRTLNNQTGALFVKMSSSQNVSGFLKSQRGGLIKELSNKKSFSRMKALDPTSNTMSQGTIKTGLAPTVNRNLRQATSPKVISNQTTKQSLKLHVHNGDEDDQETLIDDASNATIMPTDNIKNVISQFELMNRRSHARPHQKPFYGSGMARPIR